MRFRVYVRDIGLSSWVPVRIEIVDINDSRPECVSQRGAAAAIQTRSSNTIKRENNIFNHHINEQNADEDNNDNRLSKPLDIYALQVNSKPDQATTGNSGAAGARLVKLYKFRCRDADSNKNGEIGYEIEKLYLK
ncbi:unnamed protein product, partial [Sphagnum balticum]